jgi:hypothetical protein
MKASNAKTKFEQHLPGENGSRKNYEQEKGEDLSGDWKTVHAGGKNRSAMPK